MVFPLISLAVWLSLDACAASAQTAATQVDPVGGISAALRQQQFEQARQLCLAALKETPGDPRLWTLQAISQASSGMPEEAMRSFQHALKLRPDYFPALAGAAQTSFAQRRPEAHSLLERVVQAHPAGPERPSHAWHAGCAEREVRSRSRRVCPGHGLYRGQTGDPEAVQCVSGQAFAL